LGDFDAEHQQLTVYPRRSPQRILLTHPSDEVADLANQSGDGHQLGWISSANRREARADATE
jgi:hypothetical protein